MSPEDGRSPIQRSGFEYLPGFISTQESDELVAYFSSIQPIWEQRHRGDEHEREGEHPRRLTRPVYWLGAWQFACLGYYAEPDHREHRCVQAEPIAAPMQAILERLRERLPDHLPAPLDSGAEVELPNTCLINYYGRDTSAQVPRDYARLRMHRDQEPGPVIMFSIGQPALFEFVDPERSAEPELALWMRHRSVCILSGPNYKERLYHRVTRVRTGSLPSMSTQLADFALRRVSVSFRSVPVELIEELAALPAASSAKVRDYVETLAHRSPHWRAQFAALDAKGIKSGR